MSKKVSERIELFLARFDEISKLCKAWLKLSEDEALSNFEDFLIEGYLLGFAEAKSILGIKDNEGIIPEYLATQHKEDLYH